MVLHQPEEVITIGDNICRFGFRFDWTFEWEDKKFKCTLLLITKLTIGSRNCIAGIMKSMTLTYIPHKEYKDDPPVTLALFSATPSITLLDYNWPRIPITDIKGFEVIILLFAALFIDVIKSTQIEGPTGITSNDVKKETQRLQKLETKTEERLRKLQAEDIARETERLRKLDAEEMIQRKKMEEKIKAETERLRWQEGWYGDKKPPLPQRPNSAPEHPLFPTKKKRWWQSGYTERNGNGNEYYATTPGVNII